MRADRRTRGLVGAAVLALVSLVGACGGGAGAARALDAPEGTLAVDSSVHDFGVVDSGTRLEHAFRFRNASGGALALVSASATCGCTEYGLDKDAWSPGETGELRIVINTAGKRGALSVSVHALLKDERGRTLAQQFSARCVVESTELLYCEPTVLDLGQVQGPGAEARVAIVCKGLSDRPLPVSLRASAESALLSVESVRGGAFAPVASPDGERVEAQALVRLSRLPAAGVLEEALAFEVVFPDGRVRSLSVPVRARIAPLVRCSPEACYLGAVAAGSVQSDSVAVEGAQAGELRLRTSDPWIAASWDPAGTEEGAALGRVRVEVRAPERAGPFDGWIEIVDREKAVARVAVAGLAR